MIVPRPRKNPRSYLVRVEPFKAQTVYTRPAAIKLEADLKNRKALGQLWQADPVELGAEIDAHLDRRQTTKTLRDRTVEFQLQSAKPWRPLGRILVSNLTRPLIEDHFVDRARVAPVAANNELAFIKACLREAASRGQQVDPAIFAIKPVGHKAARGRALTAAELLELGSWFPEYIRRLIPLAGLGGARQSFWFALTDEMLDLDVGTMLAPAALQKNDREHRVYLSELEVDLFREQLLARPNGTPLMFSSPSGRPWNRNSFRNRVWIDAVAAAATTNPVLAGFRFHWLRHTAGSLMANAGMDPASAAERIGHTDGGALFLKTYRHLYEAERKRHVAQFSAFIAAELEPATSKPAEAQSGG